MHTELEYTAKFPESLDESLIWESEEASVQIFSIDESSWDFSCMCDMFLAGNMIITLECKIKGYQNIRRLVR